MGLRNTSQERKFDGKYQGKILVPFSPESLLSGLPEGTRVTPDDVLYYHRTFVLDPSFVKAHTVIHFDAVDMICEVKLNGASVGEHIGGYVPFEFDVSSLVKAGENVIELVVTDPCDTKYHTHAKQSSKPGGIWYTPQSGIWQSVWLESMDDVYLKDVTIVPDIDNDTINFKFVKSANVPVDVIIMDGADAIYSGRFDGDTAQIKLENYELWSPENPKLYDVAFKVGNDIVNPTSACANSVGLRTPRASSVWVSTTNHTSIRACLTKVIGRTVCLRLPPTPRSNGM